jgi:NAD(P)-dependent dehydrogenase (short-subunit alcohol dehydrogenase family)
MIDRAAVITGAAGGIGHALVAAFNAAGYRTIAVDVRATEADADAIVDIDLDDYCRDESRREQCNRRLSEAIGNSVLGVLVNNAAVQVVKDIGSLSVSDWQKTLNVNLVAPFLLSQALLECLRSARGSVVNIASIHATLTKPGFACYATSKAALVGLTRSMAVEIGSTVRVNAICPAAIATSMLVAGFAEHPGLRAELDAMHPIGRIGEPEEVAQAAVFLASDAAAFVNGAVLALDGGIGGRLHDPR